ncbi:hypothetical protein niasHS_002780 [Heterodera schachtii]|uniref:Uncharacterized protein n=1 Tax=Heterodera schachtii TaxID=97005 RepID=A0ABD2K2F5_HETSC
MARRTEGLANAGDQQQRQAKAAGRACTAADEREFAGDRPLDGAAPLSLSVGGSGSGGGRPSLTGRSTDESEQQRQIRRLAQLPPALPSRGPFAFLAIKLAAKEKERVGGEGVGQHQQQRHSTRPSSTKCGAQLGRVGRKAFNAKRKSIVKANGNICKLKAKPRSICKLTKENLNLQRKGADGNGMPKAKTV